MPPHALTYASVALATLALFAFWPTYLSKPIGNADAYTHLHVAIGTLWLTLLVTQPMLIRRRRPALHRRLGQTSWLLAHHRFSRMDAATVGQEAYTLYLPLSAALLFAAAWALALIHSDRVALHARFMACTAIVFIDPVLGRVLGFHVIQLEAFWHYQLITFAVEGLLLVALLLSLAPRTRERRIFGAFAACYAAVLVLWFFAAPTAQWRDFAAWFRRLPLT